MYLEGESLDDLLQQVYPELLDTQSRVTATKGQNYEITGVLLKLSNPRARLSRTEGKGTVFSCIGELLWYLAGTNKLDFIEYYLTHYNKSSDDGQTIFGGYGPRLFGRGHNDQISTIVKLLQRSPTSRRAVVQLFSSEDIIEYHKDIPCTCTLQFMIRDNKLNLFTCMRSNDAYKGLPHDIFAFTMIQEMVARELDLDIGAYSHYVTSLHIYENDLDKVRLYIKEGWQEYSPMPDMPTVSPVKSIIKLLKFERMIRQGKEVPVEEFLSGEYWQDIGRLLQIFRFSKDKNDHHKLDSITNDISHDIYRYYVKKKISGLREMVDRLLASRIISQGTDPQIEILGAMLEKLSNPIITSLEVIDWACPVPYFGDPTKSAVATVGLNPSNREFVDLAGSELSGHLRRFHTLSSLNLAEWSCARDAHLELIQKSCTEYFFRNPYDGWFKSLDSLIKGTNGSFYSSLFHACHLDLIPFATHKKWAHLSVGQRNKLLAISGAFLGKVVQASPLELLVLNGKTVVENFSLMTNVKFETKQHENWTLPRKAGAGVVGVGYSGKLSEISGIKIGREVHILGYNHNIQSSFGVTNKVRTEIQSWITDMAGEILG